MNVLTNKLYLLTGSVSLLIFLLLKDWYYLKFHLKKLNFVPFNDQIMRLQPADQNLTHH